jgi:hypothetical protein
MPLREAPYFKRKKGWILTTPSKFRLWKTSVFLLGLFGSRFLLRLGFGVVVIMVAV